MNVFSKKNKILISDPNFYEEVNEDIKHRIANVIEDFNEPLLSSPDRFNPTWLESTSAVLNAFAKFRNIHLIKGNIFLNMQWYLQLRLYELFDFIELLNDELSKEHSINFQEELNRTFEDEGLPWRLLDGYIIKIDSNQFENNLKIKMLKLMDKGRELHPNLQNSFEEFEKSLDFYSKLDYFSAILYACNSYESILKIILNLKEGTADSLLKQLSEDILELPNFISKPGFKDKVLSSLPYIRNNSQSAHGKGLNTDKPSKALANLTLNLAAALNTYLVEEYILCSSCKKESTKGSEEESQL